MHLHTIEKNRRVLRNAGAVEDRAHVRRGMIAQLHNDLEVISERKTAVKSDFRKRLEQWETRAVSEGAPIVANPGDIQDSRLYRLTGWIAILSEMGLAAWVFLRLGVAPWIGALTALGITLTLHGVFLYVFEAEERPKETVYRIKHYAAIPAIIGFLIALAVGAMARYVTGSVAYALLPLFSFALWLGTLSLIVLAASLFTVAHLRGWARRHERDFRELDAEERASRTFLNELEAEEHRAETPAGRQGPFRLLPAESSAKNLMGIVLIGVMLLSNSACTTASVSGGLEEMDSIESEASEAELHVFIDWSGSCVRTPLEEGWAGLRLELPAIIQEHRIGTLTLWSFDQDGWCPNRIQEMSLPVLTLPSRMTAQASEFESFSNIREAVKQAEEQERQHRERTALQHYQESLTETLASLESDSALPETSYETSKSDPVGLLQRISATTDDRTTYVIVLTDMADTRWKRLPKLPEPGAKVHVLVLLVPATPNDAALTLGKPLAGPEQFDARTRQLREAAPWIAVAPYFAKNLPALLERSEND